MEVQDEGIGVEEEFVFSILKTISNPRNPCEIGLV